MKLDCVILSSNDNPDYLEFWPIVSEAWKLMGVEPVLIYTGENQLNLKGNIINFKINNINSAFVAQNIRILYPSLFENKNVIVSDIDNLPLSRNYFLNSISNVLDDSFVIYRPNACPENMISMMWNAGNSSTWYEIFNIKNENEIEKTLKKWFNKKYVLQGKGWYTDQIKLRKYVNKFASKNGSRIIKLNDEELGFHRFNRNNLDYHFKLMSEKNTNRFTDFHMPRPYSDYEELIIKVFEFHKKFLVK